MASILTERRQVKTSPDPKNAVGVYDKIFGQVFAPLTQLRRLLLWLLNLLITRRNPDGRHQDRGVSFGCLAFPHPERHAVVRPYDSGGLFRESATTFVSERSANTGTKILKGFYCELPRVKKIK
jgi:hypothetical protein